MMPKIQQKHVATGVAILLVIFAIVLFNSRNSPEDIFSGQYTLKKFNSAEEIEAFLKEKEQSGGTFGGRMMTGTMDLAVSKSASMQTSVVSESIPTPGTSAGEFSTTNIQVEGVDEADIVKNDGKYIYVLSGNSVSIIDAYPAENAEILSNINMTIGESPQELYVLGDRLVIVGTKYAHYEYPVPADGIMTQKIAGIPIDEYYPRWISYPAAFAYIYDISDRKNPVPSRNVSVDGDYFDSRMVDGIVYLIATQYTYYYDGIRMPEIAESSAKESENKTLDVYYFDVPDTSYSFTSIASVDVADDSKDTSGKTYLIGATSNMYVSKDNIYITYQKMYPRAYFDEQMIKKVVIPLVPQSVGLEIDSIQKSNKSYWEKQDEFGKVLEEYMETLTPEKREELIKSAGKKAEEFELELAKETEKTVVRKISIDSGNIEYKKTGEVPGRVLNQFSMDEHAGYFRIATTTGRVTRAGGQTSANHVYVLDENLEIAGKIEDIAIGESIYSARFMGNRAYLVTFQKIDPLFVIDLEDPENPKILGKLKIPGYSDYLHPYDENHLIGIGKDAKPAETGDFAWYQGMKVALFDVSDVENPKEISSYLIGDRGTDSDALHDHKAFLFSKDKNLLVLPVLLAELDETKYAGELPEWAYGDYVWQGAYVFNIDTENGIELKGKITHADENDDTLMKSGWYYYGSKYSVKRSLYMDDTLYTISDGMVKANGLDNLDEINAIILPSNSAEMPYVAFAS